MSELRHRFQEELCDLEDAVQRTGVEARSLFEKALQALTSGDPALCDEVIRGDDVVDKLYLDVEQRILRLFALQTPVASDLRLLTALLHVNLHLERIGDQAVNLAKIAELTHDLPHNPKLLQHLQQMGRSRSRWLRPRWTRSRAATLTSRGNCPRWTTRSTG